MCRWWGAGHVVVDRGLQALPSFLDRLYLGPMNIFDFLKQDEIEDAPEDPAMAFTYLVRIAQGRFDERQNELAQNDVEGYAWEDARMGFMSTVISLGKTYGIEPFSGLEVPRFSKFGYDDFRQFKADLDHYLAQLVMGNALRARRDSIKLSTEAKARIRTHLHHIKDHIDKTEMPEAKRAALHAKLAEFEAALEKDRLNILKVGAWVLGILSVSANVAQLADSQSFHKLVSNVMVTVGEEKAVDDENRKLPPVDPMPLMLPPRRDDDFGKPTRDLFSANLDDEIPF